MNIIGIGGEQLQKMNVTFSLMNTAYSISGTVIVHEQHNFIMYYVKYGIFNKAEKKTQLPLLRLLQYIPYPYPHNNLS